MPKSRVKKALAKVKKLGKKAYNKAKNDPEIRDLVNNTAQQMKREVINGIKAGMTEASAGRITGSGDYYTSNNINRGGGIAARSLKVARSIVIERQEFIGTVVSSSTAKNTVINKYRINPGNYVTFPWGSSVALGYESWMPMQAQIVYKTTSGDALNASDTSLGKVSLAAQYNTYARDWDSFLELENANDSVTGAPSANMMLGLECKKGLRGSNSLYVSQQDPNSAGKGFYDLCDVYVASTGCQGTSVRLGDIFIRYKIKLFNPIVRDSEVPACVFGIQGTIASTSTAFSTTGTVVENISTRQGGTLTLTSNSVITLTVKPSPGRSRLSLQYVCGQSGSANTRVFPSFTVTATYLGNTVAVSDDTSLTSSAINLGVANISTAYFCSSMRNVVIQPMADTITITASSTGYYSGDIYQLVGQLTPYEVSDF